MTIEHKRLGSILKQRMMAMCPCEFTGEWSFTCSSLQGKHSVLRSQRGCPERLSCSLWSENDLDLLKGGGWIRQEKHP